jgi:hypothetical protein
MDNSYFGRSEKQKLGKIGGKKGIKGIFFVFNLIVLFGILFVIIAGPDADSIKIFPFSVIFSLFLDIRIIETNLLIAALFA